MIVVKIPDSYEKERRYILAVIFGEFLGLEIQVEVGDCKNTIVLPQPDLQIEIADVLFATPISQWLQPESLPSQPLKIWDLDRTNIRAMTVTSQVPIIYGEDPARADFFTQSEARTYLGIDIFGSAFFMLTRYEEVAKPDRDPIDRFPATASLAYQEDFLTRPIINEYLEILWACMLHFNPSLKRKRREFQMVVSHDVDEPFRYAFSGVRRLIKRCAGDIYRRHSPILAAQSILQAIQVKSGNYHLDPCNTFDLIMDISEKNNIKSAFYFIADRTHKTFDGDYSIEHPLIRDLLRRIHERGHEIGLHTSYHTYQNPAQTKKEFDILQRVCTEEGIQQQNWGGRQHCLRWETPTTFQNWNDARLDYDSTLYFADAIGFRCGVCYEFTTFNLKTRMQLKLKERSLTVMECTLLDERYSNVGSDHIHVISTIANIKKSCKKFEGDFSILWHNNRFISSREVDIYENVIS